MDSRKIKVALLIDKSESYDRGLIKGVIKFSNLSTPWDFFLYAPNYTVVDKKKKIIKKVIDWCPDCIVMNDRFVMSDFKTLGVPIFVTPSNHKVQNAVNIVANDKEIGKIGAEYFIKRGFENLAFYGSDYLFWSTDRKQSFKETVLANGRSYFEEESLINEDWQNNLRNLVSWLQNLPKPVAIMACSDEFGIHLIEAAQLAELDVPQEVAVLGVDNDEFICDLYRIPMSSIDQSPEEVGFLVAQTIRKFLVAGEEMPSEIVGTNFHIVTRLSTDIFAIEDQQLKIALEYIEAHSATKIISVDDVVLATCLSRRLLEIRFRNVLNRTILQEIKRIRQNIICSKLILSNDPINQIAFDMGFNSLTSFSNSFRKEMNMSPVEFRKQFKSKEI